MGGRPRAVWGETTLLYRLRVGACSCYQLLFSTCQGVILVVARYSNGASWQFSRSEPFRMYSLGARAKPKRQNRQNGSAIASEQRTSRGGGCPPAGRKQCFHR